MPKDVLVQIPQLVVDHLNTVVFRIVVFQPHHILQPFKLIVIPRVFGVLQIVTSYSNPSDPPQSSGGHAFSLETTVGRASVVAVEVEISTHTMERYHVWSYM